MAGFITAEGIVVPAGSDTYDYVNDQRRLAGSIRSIAPAPDRAAGDTIAAAMATDGRAVSSTNPLIIFNQAKRHLEIKDATGWMTYGMKNAEFTGPTTSSPANAGINFGLMTADGSRTFNNTFVTPGAPTGLTVSETGIYLVYNTGICSANPGNTHLWGVRSGSASDTIISVNFIGYGSSTMTGCAMFYAVANDTLTFGITTANTVNVDSRVKMVKLF